MVLVYHKIKKFNFIHTGIEQAEAKYKSDQFTMLQGRIQGIGLSRMSATALVFSTAYSGRWKSIIDDFVSSSRMRSLWFVSTHRLTVVTMDTVVSSETKHLERGKRHIKKIRRPSRNLNKCAELGVRSPSWREGPDKGFVMGRDERTP